MATMKENYGSFKALFKIDKTDIFKNTKDESYNPNQEEYVEYTVNPLTQKELADGWRLVIPQVQYKFRQFKDSQGKVQRKKTYFYDKFKINLAQLPYHLWQKQQGIYEEGVYSHSIVRDGRYMYIVQPTQVDDEIRELRKYITCHVHSNIWNIYDPNPYISPANLERMRELVNTLQDNSINGWVLIRAKRLLAERQ